MKQAFSTIRKKNKAALLRYIPNVEWFLNSDYNNYGKNKRENNTKKTSIEATLNLGAQLQVTTESMAPVTPPVTINIENELGPDSVEIEMQGVMVFDKDLNDEDLGDIIEEEEHNDDNRHTSIVNDSRGNNDNDDDSDSETP